VILLYHRIGNPDLDPWALAVSPEHFEEHLTVLSNRRAVRLTDLLKTILAGTPSQGTFAVTFDDGYAETAHIARSRLRAYEAPATFFVPSGAIGSPLEFWWDELESLVLGPSRLPESLALQLPDGRFEPALERDGSWGLNYLTPSGWRAWHEPPPTRRHALYTTLWERCRRLASEDRERVLDSVRAWAGGSVPPRETHRCMTADEVRGLAADDLFDVGAHSVTHPSLGFLPAHIQKREICSGKRTLEDLSGQQVDTFAYPFGKRADYTDETVRLVAQSGFRGACVNFPGPISADVDVFQLPRLFVEDWSGEEFRARLAGLMNSAFPGL
jgi:peptidoglycan/xylan/chitin deacetylase (PgdA/CDA1 family)